MTVTDWRARAIRFVQLEGGCWVPLTHRLNADGYFRKNWKVPGQSGKKKAEMFHRFIYRAHFGEIPKGHEVDHMCNNRACCNPEHLQVLSRRDHLIKTNRNRYAARFAEAKSYWLEHSPTGVALGALFGVAGATASDWIRQWKAEQASA